MMVAECALVLMQSTEICAKFPSGCSVIKQMMQRSLLIFICAFTQAPNESQLFQGFSLFKKYSVVILGLWGFSFYYFFLDVFSKFTNFHW